MHYGWTSISFPQILNSNSTISVTNEQGSWIASAMLIGIFFGANLGALIVDIIGRKHVILLTTFPYFISWIMIAYAKSFAIFVFARLIAGICDGLMIASLPIYVGEISDPKIRGLLGSCIGLSMISGILLINIIGTCLTLQVTAFVSSIPPIIVLLTFIWMPESPYYLIMKGKVDMAKKSIRKLKGSDCAESELKRLLEVVEKQNATPKRYLDLFTVKSNRKALLIFVGTRTFQQFGGPIAIGFYAQTVFEEGSNSISPSAAAIIYFSMQVLFSAICTAIVDKTGRKPLMLISILGTILTLTTEGAYFYFLNKTDADLSDFKWLPILTLIVYVIMFSLGMQVIPMLLMGELFPTNVKAAAMSVCNSYFAFITTVVTKLFQFTKDEFGIHVPMFIFAISSIFGLVFIVFIVPETRGKTLEEIQNELQGRRREKEIVEERELLTHN